MEIELTTLTDFISKTNFISTGAITETKYCHYLGKDFPNFEIFWKSIIVPFTNRILADTPNVEGFTDPREGVSDELREIGSFHYSIFLNLVYAHISLEEKQFSFFENFYMHLGSACDLVEEFLLKVYLLIAECENIPIKVLSKLTKDEFVSISAIWYDENYEALYENYYKKGKVNPIKIPNRKYFLSEYFEKNEAWKAYVTFSQLLRQYRNTIVHHYKIAFLQDDEGRLLVPRKEKLSNYKKWTQVEEASQDSIKQSDFILQETLMADDIKNLKQILNTLWSKPIDDISNLLFDIKNTRLLEKYNMEFV